MLHGSEGTLQWATAPALFIHLQTWQEVRKTMGVPAPVCEGQRELQLLLQFSFNIWLFWMGLHVFYDCLEVLRRWNKCWAGLAAMLMCSPPAAMLL